MLDYASITNDCFSDSPCLLFRCQLLRLPKSRRIDGKIRSCQIPDHGSHAGWTYTHDAARGRIHPLPALDTRCRCAAVMIKSAFRARHTFKLLLTVYRLHAQLQTLMIPKQPFPLAIGLHAACRQRRRQSRTGQRFHVATFTS